MVDHLRARRAMCSLFIAAAVGIGATPETADGFEDPTPGLIPTLECEASTCREAASAVESNEYARAGELFETHAAEAGSEGDIRGAWLVYGAYAYEQTESWADAASMYARAADQIDSLNDYLLTRAVRASLEEGDPDRALLERALETGALRAGYEDGHLLEAKVRERIGDGPDADIVERALTSTDDPAPACSWLLGVLEQRPGTDDRLFDLAHGHCVGDDFTERLRSLDYEPSTSARMRRGERLIDEVDFEAALEELEAIDAEALDGPDRCRLQFRRARSHYFLRRYSTAVELYTDVVDECDDEATEDLRVRSLYGAGDRKYQRGKLDEARALFETLYREYPDRSHADDALLYLARIERQSDDADRDRELELLRTALEEYPDGDMTHEMVWEVFESTFRDGDYRTFIDAVTGLPLPGWDQKYFSQGRLEYFVGLAYRRLDQPETALEYWQRTWVKYPFSFYGYLARLRLVEHGETPEALADGPPAEVDWFDGEFARRGPGILARAGHLDGACNLERQRLSLEEASRSERWRLATLCHRAGQHSVSHNVARRHIPGRPWSLPARGRLARWHVAWPDPYRDRLESAIDDFGPDEPLEAGLPAAIMREESSFEEDVVSWAGAVGLMQLMPSTARNHDDVVQGEATVERLRTAEVNIPVGVDHLATLSASLDAHPVLMVAAYNAGAGRVRSWLRRHPNDEIALWVEDIPILQTRNYTKRVIGSYGAYQYLAGTDRLDDRVADPAR